MRVLGVDLGGRRIGLAISDATGTLARPLRTLETGAVHGAEQAADLLAREVDMLAMEPDGLGAIVLGVPRRLDGSPTPQTGFAHAVAAALRGRAGVPVHLQDERLTSREAESRLALRERDWRKRKQRLDAAAAAVILQDFLDTRS